MRVRSAFTPSLLATLCVACAIDAPRSKQTDHPFAGLYTPGSQLGASDPTDTPTPGMGLGERCVSLGTPPDGGMPTPGQLNVEYTTRSLEGRYAPDNCTATWIETLDGRYVATIEVRAALRRPGLVYWQDHACVDKTGPDVVATATLQEHGMHTLVWKGFDLDEKPVPDGTYKLFIEVTETDKEPGEFATFEFDKGPVASGGVVPVDFEGPLESLSIRWEPEVGGE